MPGEVRIRKVEDSDLEVFFEQQLEPEAIQMAAFPARERDPFMAHWAKIRADPTVVLRTVVVDGQVAGNVVCWETLGVREAGYWIGQAFWGRGIATEALTLFLAEMTTRPLFAYVAAHNVGSIRVLEKCGFRPFDAGEGSPLAEDTGDVAAVALVLET